MSGGKLVGTVDQPGLCEKCGPEFVAEIDRKPDLTAATKYCPHTGTVALAFIGPYEGGRIIRHWVQERPVEPDDAIEMMHRLAALFDDCEAVNLRDPVHLQ